MAPSQFVLVNNETKQEYPITGMINIGRSDDNDIVLDAPSVSRYHGRIDYSDNRLILKDLDSTNGTSVNGEMIKRDEIFEGSQLKFGDVAFSVKIGDSDRTIINIQGKPPPEEKTRFKTDNKIKPGVETRSILAQDYFHKQLKGCVLTPIDKGWKEYSFPVNTISTIGRLDLSDVFIDSKHVSRNHAIIEVSAREVMLSDTNSANGTFVNDEPIKKQVLADGDIISFAGEVSFTVSISSDEMRSFHSLTVKPDYSFIDVVQDTDSLIEYFHLDYGEQILLEVERQTMLFYIEFENYLKTRGREELHLNDIRRFITLISKAAAIHELPELTGHMRIAVDQLTTTQEGYQVTFFEIPDSNDNRGIEINGFLINFPNGMQLVVSDIPYENVLYMVFAASWLAQLSITLQ